MRAGSKGRARRRSQREFIFGKPIDVRRFGSASIARKCVTAKRVDGQKNDATDLVRRSRGSYGGRGEVLDSERTCKTQAEDSAQGNQSAQDLLIAVWAGKVADREGANREVER